jgi:hypothetical protein
VRPTGRAVAANAAFDLLDALATPIALIRVNARPFAG